MNKERQAIFDKTEGRCLYCGDDLSGKRWQADHFHPIVRHQERGTCLFPKLDVIDNIFPACSQCNNFKSSLSIDGFRDRIRNQEGVTIRQSTGLRQLHRLGLVEFKDTTSFKFWYELHGISVPDRDNLMGFDIERYSKLQWHRDETDKCDYLRLPDGVLTLRVVGNTYLAIYTDGDWNQKRQEFERIPKRDLFYSVILWAESKGINLGV